MDKQETIIQQLQLVWKAHPDWTFGKLISIILSMEHLEPRLMYMSDEDLFKRSIHLSKDAVSFKIKKLPIKSRYKASELIAHVDDFLQHLEQLKEISKVDSKFEQVLAYALLVDEVTYMREYLKTIC